MKLSSVFGKKSVMERETNTMKRLKILKEQYMPYIKKPKHDTAFMIDFLTSKCDCISQSNDFMGKFFFDSLLSNVYNCFLNQLPVFDKKDFSFKCFTVTKNEKSRIYYADMELQDTIYVIFEEKTCYIESNCNMLFLELFIEKGIDDIDLSSENNYCKSYFSYLERYIQAKQVL